MENGLSFERKISFEPLLISIILGLVIGIIIWSIFPKYLLLGIILGIVSFILESLLIYPKYLSELYDYWYVDTQGVHYYDYSTWGKRVQAIFLPLWKKKCHLSFSKIRSVSVLDGKSIMNTQYPLGGTFKAPLTRKIHYLLLQTDQQQIRLRFAWRSSGIPTTDNDIKEIKKYIDKKIVSKKESS